MDFFDPTDWRYEYRLKKERKNTAARHSSRDCGIAIFRVWISALRGLRYPGIGSLSEYEPILKIFAIYVEFSTVQSIRGGEILPFVMHVLTLVQKIVLIYRNLIPLPSELPITPGRDGAQQRKSGPQDEIPILRGLAAEVVHLFYD